MRIVRYTEYSVYVIKCSFWILQHVLHIVATGL